MTRIVLDIESSTLALVDLAREDVPLDRWIVRAVEERLVRRHMGLDPALEPEVAQPQLTH